jgi:ATP-dependent exoDNAse (exonuclease V) alpha subunit
MKGKPTYRYAPVHVDKKTVLILDEAGMLDTKASYDACREVRKRGGTIIFTGDLKQLQPIAAGGPFRHLVEVLSASHLGTSLRQQDEADRQAADHVRRGDASQALANFAGRGRLIVAKDREQALRQLVESWTDAGGAKHPERHIIFTPTRLEAQAANRLCQQQRLARGEIKATHSLHNGDHVLCLGDRVLFHKNVFADGIRNGYRGTIVEVDRFRGRLTIRLDGAHQMREVTIRLCDYGPEGLTQAYAQTTHKGQGNTVDHAYLLVGGKLADREMGYVQVTRGKFSTRLFVDEAHAGEELRDLARSLSRSRPKELAHDVAKRARPDLTMNLTNER